MPKPRHELRKAVALQQRAHESWRKSRDPAMRPGLRIHHQESASTSYGWARWWIAKCKPEGAMVEIDLSPLFEQLESGHTASVEVVVPIDATVARLRELTEEQGSD